MKSKSFFHLMAVIAALYVALLSFFIGLRHLGYIMTAMLSAILIWSVLCFLNNRKHRAGFIAGIVIGLAVQQVAYQVWKSELPGFCWPLLQFGALQCLIAYGMGRTVP